MIHENLPINSESILSKFHEHMLFLEEFTSESRASLWAIIQKTKEVQGVDQMKKNLEAMNEVIQLKK